MCTHMLPCFHNQLLPGSMSMPINSTRMCTCQVQPISLSQSIKIKTLPVSAPLRSPAGTKLPAVAQYGVSKANLKPRWVEGNNPEFCPREFRDQSQRPIL
jgi:hypothetical protein